MDDEHSSPEDNARYQPAAHAPQFGTKKKSKKWLLWLTIAIVVLLVAGAVYWFLAKDKSTPKQKLPSTTQAKKPADTLREPAANATSKTFKSAKLNVEFAYRSDWTVKETADKEEVILTSPRVAYTTKDGVATQGVFTVKMRHGIIPDAMQTTVQSAVAVKDSEVIAYDQPTEAQRHYTNVSFGGVDAKNFGLFIVSGSTTYKAGQPFGSQIDLLGNAYVFAGGYGADTGDVLAFDAVPAVSFDTEAYQQALAVIKSLKIF